MTLNWIKRNTWSVQTPIRKATHVRNKAHKKSFLFDWKTRCAGSNTVNTIDFRSLSQLKQTSDVHETTLRPVIVCFFVLCATYQNPAIREPILEWIERLVQVIFDLAVFSILVWFFPSSRDCYRCFKTHSYAMRCAPQPRISVKIHSIHSMGLLAIEMRFDCTVVISV